MTFESFDMALDAVAMKAGMSPWPASRSRVSLRAHVADPAVQLWAVAGACWVALLAGGHHHQILVLGTSVAADPGAAWLFLGYWLEMIGAMMLPTTVPMVRKFRIVSARAPRSVLARLAFLAGYVALWLAFALAALVAATLLQTALGSAWLDMRPYWVLAVALAAAGLFQFSPLKESCLTQCRDPMAFLFQHYRRGVVPAFALGLRHGKSCLGCCWALMLIMCFTGMVSLLAMFLLMVVMLAEKVTPQGRRMTAPIGVVLLFAAAVVAWFGNENWGWFVPMYAMDSLCVAGAGV